MKRVTFILLCGIMVMFAAANTALAQTSGTTGPLTWNFDSETGVLTITGEGAMPNYPPAPQGCSPWYHLNRYITGAVNWQRGNFNWNLCFFRLCKSGICFHPKLGYFN